MVPEFMHRDFYRSQEGELEAVEPSGRLKAIRSRRQPAPPKPVKTTQPMEPLRSGSVPTSQELSRSAEDESRTPLQPIREPSPQTDTVVIPREPESKSNLNFPLVVCLLFIVGLFLWREQTRPQLSPEQELPIPKSVPITKEVNDSDVLGADSPYPEMSPGVAVKVDGPEEVRSEDELELNRSDSEDEQPVTLPQEPDDIPSHETAEATTESPSEASAQRAAILNRMSEGTVSKSVRESRMERDARAPRTPDDSSLFPEMGDTTPPAPSVAEPSEPSLKGPAAATAVEVPDDSLFPEDSAKPGVVEPVKQTIAPPPARKPKTTRPAGGQGEPYQIAEPAL